MIKLIIKLKKKGKGKGKPSWVGIGFACCRGHAAGHKGTDGPDIRRIPHCGPQHPNLTKQNLPLFL